MLQLPNTDETKDPVVKKLIIAVQELADQVGTRDTVIFHGIHQEIKGLRNDITHLENTMDSRFESQNQILSSLENSVNSRFESQNQILSSLENSVNSRFESQNQILSSLENSVNSRFESQNQILSSLENSVNSRFESQNQILSDMASTLKTIAKNTENKPKYGKQTEAKLKTRRRAKGQVFD